MTATHADSGPDPDAPQLAVREPRHEGGVLETLESITIAFVLAFVFRAFIVEAFVIPTGSMAPTLLGQHISMTCPQCGYRFAAGPRETLRAADGTMVAKRVQERVRVPCPMCDYLIEYRAVRSSAGDRILVLKYIYALTEPNRWDVVVFKNPREPDVNYIKRLVGLPGEAVWIVDGNIYTRPVDAGGAVRGPWRIQRKIHRPDVQRAAWQPVYHSDFFPLDDGQVGRTPGRLDPWSIPWQPAGETADRWQGLRGFRWQYSGGGDGEGVLDFDFSHEHDRYNYYPYNTHDARSAFDDEGSNLIAEMRIAVTVMPQEPGAGIELISGGRHMTVRGRVDAQGRVTIDASLRAAGEGGPSPWRETGAAGQVAAPAVGRAMRIELWHVDHSASVWVDGKLAAGPWEYELEDAGVSLESLADGELRQPEPVAQVVVRGGAALLRSIGLDRDLFYTQATTHPGRGTYGGPAVVPAEHFFCLGDNSPSSEDSRRWTDVDPWVLAVRESPAGFVPRELMLGRAFFVYYPASHHLVRSPLGAPNFGKMRFIH